MKIEDQLFIVMGLYTIFIFYLYLQTDAVSIYFWMVTALYFIALLKIYKKLQ